MRGEASSRVATVAAARAAEREGTRGSLPSEATLAVVLVLEAAAGDGGKGEEALEVVGEGEEDDDESIQRRSRAFSTFWRRLASARQCDLRCSFSFSIRSNGSSPARATPSASGSGRDSSVDIPLPTCSATVGEVVVVGEAVDGLRGEEFERSTWSGATWRFDCVRERRVRPTRRPTTPWNKTR